MILTAWCPHCIKDVCMHHFMQGDPTGTTISECRAPCPECRQQIEVVWPRKPVGDRIVDDTEALRHWGTQNLPPGGYRIPDPSRLRAPFIVPPNSTLTGIPGGGFILEIREGDR